MLAIVTGLKEWEHMLRSYKDEFIVYTDHKNLEYFASTKSVVEAPSAMG